MGVSLAADLHIFRGQRHCIHGYLGVGASTSIRRRYSGAAAKIRLGRIAHADMSGFVDFTTSTLRGTVGGAVGKSDDWGGYELDLALTHLGSSTGGQMRRTRQNDHHEESLAAAEEFHRPIERALQKLPRARPEVTKIAKTAGQPSRLGKFARWLEQPPRAS
jgi:hypothetical protein